MKKHIIVEVIDKESNETLEKIKVTRTQVLRYDERTYPHIMRANAMQIAKQKFCREYEENVKSVGASYEFINIEEV